MQAPPYKAAARTATWAKASIKAPRAPTPNSSTTSATDNGLARGRCTRGRGPPVGRETPSFSRSASGTAVHGIATAATQADKGPPARQVLEDAALAPPTAEETRGVSAEAAATHAAAISPKATSNRREV